MEADWHIVESKHANRSRKAKRPVQSSLTHGQPSPSSAEPQRHRSGRASLKASMGEMNADLLPQHRAEMSSRPRGTKHGVHVASTSCTIRREFERRLEPDTLDRVTVNRDALVDEYGVTADGWFQVQSNSDDAAALWRWNYADTPGASVNKKRRWLLLDEAKEADDIVKIQYRRYVNNVDGSFSGVNYDEPAFARPVSEMAPVARMEAPSVARGRKGTQVKEKRLPGKQVASRERNLRKFPRWADGSGQRYMHGEEVRFTAIVAPGVSGSRRLPPHLTKLSPEEMEGDIYRVHRRDAHRVPRGRRNEWNANRDERYGRMLRRQHRTEKDWRSQLN